MNAFQNFPLENLIDFRVHIAGLDGGASNHLTQFFQWFNLASNYSIDSGYVPDLSAPIVRF
jgi:hypothetical protein